MLSFFLEGTQYIGGQINILRKRKEIEGFRKTNFEVLFCRYTVLKE